MVLFSSQRGFSPLIIIFGVLLLVILVGGGVFAALTLTNKPAPAKTGGSVPVASSVPRSISPPVQSTQPVSAVSSESTSYQNPFDSSSANPFGQNINPFEGLQ